MIGEQQKNLIYYRCHKKHCPVTGWREEAVQNSVLEKLAQFEFQAGALARLKSEVQSWPQNRSDSDSLNTAKHLAEIDSKLEKLTDTVVAGVIDRDSFHKRKQALLLERRAFEDSLARGSQKLRSTYTLSQFLELAKTLTGIYQIMNDNERRELLEITTSNRLLDRKKLSFEPRNWLQWGRDDRFVSFGARSRQQTRRAHTDASDDINYTSTNIETVMQAMQTEEVARFIALCQSAMDRANNKKPAAPKEDRFKAIE